MRLPARYPLVVDELFLPFRAVRPCDGLEARIAEGNAVLYGLTAGVYPQFMREQSRTVMEG